MINKTIKQTCICFLLLSSGVMHAQVQSNPPMRQVLGTVGGTGTLPSGNIIDYTVGECVVTTVGPFNTKYLTQGFQQSDASGSTLNETVNTVNSSCTGANNGSVMFQNISATGTVMISWDGGAPGTTRLFSNLSPGSYPYVISDGNFSITDTAVITEDAVDCGEQLTFYHGITPNADGHNDLWEIDGITNFAESKVLLYNRWGDLVWKADNYNNTTVVWDGKNSKGENLTDATYFYIVEAGGKTYKGWIELTH
jgi:gliding motility-associated-like protein